MFFLDINCRSGIYSGKNYDLEWYKLVVFLGISSLNMVYIMVTI